MQKPILQSTFEKPDAVFEKPLRPLSLSDFIGQAPIKKRLEIVIKAAKQRGDPLGHCLFYGPPGLGKTTLAHILANEMQTHLVVTSGPAIEKAADLAGLLTNLNAGDILFIDEIHRLNKTIEEYLYPAMESFSLDLMIDSGPSARSVQITLNPFTLIGATTKSGLLTGPIRSRFTLSHRLDFYDKETLAQIIAGAAEKLNIQLLEEAAIEIAKRSRGTPRIAINLLRFVRDVAQTQNQARIDGLIAAHALEILHIDERGLNEMDKKILNLIIDHYNGGPVGIKTLAVAIGEEAETIEEVYEPYLVMEGFIKRTPRGREATELAYQHLEKTGDL